VEVVASLPQGRTAAAQCGLFTHKSVPVIFEPPCTFFLCLRDAFERHKTKLNSGIKFRWRHANTKPYQIKLMSLEKSTV
jgi:hypothetical protein